MRTETYTVTKTYYTYDELSEQEKEQVRRDYIDTGFRNEEFYDDTRYELSEVFSDINCEYQLSYCQGDGFNTYGTATMDEIFKAAEWYKIESPEQFTPKEKRALIFYGGNWRKIKIPANRRYEYSMAEHIDFAEDWIYDLQVCCGYKNVNEELIRRFETFCVDVFSTINSYYEHWGYEYLYNIPDEEYAELSDINDWEYDEDGKIA